MRGEVKADGTLVAIGGAEEKKKDPEILRALVKLPEGGAKRVEIIPVASEVPEESAGDYTRTFRALGVPHIGVMDIRSRADAEDPALARRVGDSDIVFFTGGDQLRITARIGGTAVDKALHEHYVAGGVVAGTSAGAAAMSGTMIFEGNPERGLTKGNVQMRPGLALVPHAVIDTHLIHRGRLSRLLEVVADNPGILGVGLGEDTGIIIRRGGAHLEAVGSGVVIVMDGHGIGHTNICDVKLGDPIAVEGVVVHTLTSGYVFDVAKKEFLPPQSGGDTQ